MNGAGEYNYDTHQFRLDVAVSGLADGRLSYRRDDDSSHAAGTYAGEPVNLDSG
jgi:hypothetical protein